MFELNQRESRQIKDKASKLQPLFVFLALVSLSTPAAAGTINVHWDAETSTDVVGYKVYYNADSSAAPYAGTGAAEGASPIDVANQTSTTLTGLDPSHSYYVAITAYDSTGMESVYSTSVYVPESVPPTVAITSPASGAMVSGVLPIGVSASDNVGVTRLEMYVNGTLLATDTAAPYAFSWDTTTVPAGIYTLSARAYDAAGNMGESDVTINVGTDTVPPTVTLASPVNGSTLSGTVAITANATDNFGVTKVELYENGTLLGASNVQPFTYSWNTTSVVDGSYMLSARAYDASGNVGQSSVSVTVKNADTTPPVVTSFSMPATSTSLTVPVSGFAATDNVGVTGYLISESASAPSASAGWSTVPPASFTFAGAGTRTAYAWAKDAAGNISTAASASVSVGDVTPPAITAFSMPSTYNSLTVPLSTFTATDNVGVTGYLITESSSTPSASATGWSSAAPSTFTFSGTGTRTAYAWTKDAAGNVSTSSTDTVVVDTSAPVITSLSPANGTVLTSSSVNISASSTDNIKVTMVQVYIDNALKVQTSAPTFSWSTTISAKGTHVIMVKALDAAGNVGSRSVTIYR